jgi:hypothetical protein
MKALILTGLGLSPFLRKLCVDSHRDLPVYTKDWGRGPL